MDSFLATIFGTWRWHHQEYCIQWCLDILNSFPLPVFFLKLLLAPP